jgi:hypothetical protein
MTHRIEQKGFIALTSVLILSIVMLTLAVGVGMRAWYTRVDIFLYEKSVEVKMKTYGCESIEKLQSIRGEVPGC